MRAVVIAIVAVGLVGTANAGRAADEKDPVVGTWEIVFSDTKDVAVGTKLEFTKDGKVSFTFAKDGKDTTVDGGGYKIEKDVLTFTGKDGTKNDKGRICLLNKTSFIINDEIEDKVMVLKRVKGK